MNDAIERRVEQAQPIDRHLSTTAIRSGQIGPMLLQQARSEFLKLWRIPMFSIPTLLFPILLFLLFGAPIAGETLPNGTSIGKYVMASFAAYGMLGIAFFSFGIGVANERGQGWTKLARATPMPAWVYFAGKVVMALVFATLLLMLFLVAALVAGIRMGLNEWALLIVTLVLGMLPLVTAGFALGYWAGPNSAAAIANLIYLPIAYASGLSRSGLRLLRSCSKSMPSITASLVPQQTYLTRVTWWIGGDQLPDTALAQYPQGADTRASRGSSRARATPALIAHWPVSHVQHYNPQLPTPNPTPALKAHKGIGLAER